MLQIVGLGLVATFLALILKEHKSPIAFFTCRIRGIRDLSFFN
ncbi:hypothetical protein F6Y05_25720 [Bacillus megaterium]|nr:hypothetical protein [Priestia megaterium]